MAKRMKSSSFTSSIIFTILIFIFFISSLLLINYHYKGEIKAQERQREYDLITSVLDVDFDNNPLDEKTFISSADGKEKLELYPARQEGIVTSIIMRVKNEKAYGGYMELFVGFYMDGTISGYRIVTHNETLGLGSKITEPEFYEQFEGFNPERHNFKVSKEGGDIDAVTSATISSKAVIDSIQKAYDAYAKFMTGE